jgi:hypothetical protein
VRKKSPTVEDMQSIIKGENLPTFSDESQFVSKCSGGVSPSHKKLRVEATYKLLRRGTIDILYYKMPKGAPRPVHTHTHTHTHTHNVV